MGRNHFTGGMPQGGLSYDRSQSGDRKMLSVQQSLQHLGNVTFAIAVIALVTMVYWRLALRLLLIVVVVATVVGAAALLQIIHR
jgi:hypothetical protein